MENLTNFNILSYIYLSITIGTLIYPIKLWFRVSFVNFIFMVILSAFTLFFQTNFDQLLIFLNIFDDDNILFIVTILSIFIAVAIYFTINKNISLLDSLLLGFLPFFVVFDFMFVFFRWIYHIDINIIIVFALFFLFYGMFIHQKLLWSLPFSVKGMSDKY